MEEAKSTPSERQCGQPWKGPFMQYLETFVATTPSLANDTTSKTATASRWMPLTKSNREDTSLNNAQYILIPLVRTRRILSWPRHQETVITRQWKLWSRGQRRPHVGSNCNALNLARVSPRPTIPAVLPIVVLIVTPRSTCCASTTCSG